MKSSILLAFAAILILAGCSREDARYEIVRTDKGVIRLDKKSGEMIAVSEYHIPSVIDTAALKEDFAVDPLISVIKAFPDFRLPGSKKVVMVKIQYRWLNGRMDYRMTVTPYFEGWVSKIHSPKTRYEVLCCPNQAQGEARFSGSARLGNVCGIALGSFLRGVA